MATIFERLRAPFGQTTNGAQLRALESQVSESKRAFLELQLQIEDRNWRRIGNNNDHVSGVDLSALQTLSDDLRSWVTAGGIMKRLAELRGEYAYGDGFTFTDTTEAFRKALESETNQARVFSVDAMAEINRAHATDGTVVVLVNRSTGDTVRVPFDELGEPYIDPDDKERIWYVRRKYTRMTSAGSDADEVDIFYRATTLPERLKGRTLVKVGEDEQVRVDRDWVAVVWAVNRQTGWAFGIPDLFASLQWAEKYTGYLKNQDKFAEALAAIAWQWSASSTDLAKKVAANLVDGSKVGQSAVNGPELEAKPMSGNSNVSFENGSPLAGQAAAAAGLTVESVLGSADRVGNGKLDADVVRMVNTRRRSATVFFKALGRLLGAPDLDVVWPDIESETPFREAQMLIAAWEKTGLFHPEEVRGPLASKLSMELKPGSKAPKGVLQPKNSGKDGELAAKAKLAKQAADDSASIAGDDDSGDGANGQGKDGLGVGKLSDGDNTARDKNEV